MSELNIAIADDNQQTLDLLTEILEGEEGIQHCRKGWITGRTLTI